MRRNEGLLRRKWARDIEMGYASALSGLTPDRLVFHDDRHPDSMVRRMEGLARRADISLCMIVRDEERVIGECLASAAPFFRETIVVDTGSTDRTPEIVEAAGARLYRMDWPDSFSEARNESLRHAQGRWVFWMDADDTLPWASGEALVEAVLSAPPDVIAFVVPVQFVDERSADGRIVGTRVDHVKLFRNMRGAQFEGRIHEQVLGSLRRRRPDGRIVRSNAVVLHSGYDASPEGQAKKRARDFRLLGLDYRDRPKHPFVLFNIGMTYHYTGDHRRAIRWLRRCLQVSKPDESHVRKAYALLGVSVRETEGAEAALKVFEDGLGAVGEDAELGFQAAASLVSLATSDASKPDPGLLARARELYERCLKADASEHFSSMDTGLRGYKTMHNLGSACMLMGDYRSARDWWLRAMADSPSYLPSAFALFDAALETGDFVTARRMIEAVRSGDGSGQNVLGMQVRMADAVGGEANGDEFLMRAVGADPKAVSPRLLLARRLLNTGREAAALPHLNVLQESGVAEAAYFLGVSASRDGDHGEALKWMSRALELDPEHEETARQIAALHEAMAATV
ncbi:MAG: glycosyltransferase [Armatimonadetes bacterium]|nr:glycosyltransferase [Armatimonadota bacterium]